MYYDRTISPRLLSKLKSPEYQKIIEYVKCHEGLELYFRKTKDTSSMGTLYKGRGAILSLNTKGAFYDIKKQKEQTESQKKPKRQYIKSEDFTEAELDNFIEESWKNGSPKAREDQYNDAENEKNEGYYQSLVGRRYSLFSQSNDPFIIFDKEFEIGYESLAERSEAEEANGKNERCDYIGLNRDGHLMLIEVKISSNWDIGNCANQIDTYRKSLKDLLKKKEEYIKSNILLMIGQKQKKELGLINKDWTLEAPINGTIELAIVIGDLKVAEDKTEADEIATRRFRRAKHGAEKIKRKGIIHYYAWNKNGDLIEITNENEKLLGFKEPGQVGFKEREQEKNIDLMEDPKGWFKGDFGNGSYKYKGKTEQKPYILNEWRKNLYESYDDEYGGGKSLYHQNKKGEETPIITLHPAKANTTSSQIACLNHLWYIAYNPDFVKALVNGLIENEDTAKRDDNENPQFKSVLPLKDGRYIDFEVKDPKNKKDGHMKESQCTSIDALILAEKFSSEITLIVIEWKYTENDHSTDESIITYKNKKGTTVYSGKTRMETYNSLINKSRILNHLSKKDKYPDNRDDYKSSVYYIQPFYELMRQTLWIETFLGYDKKFDIYGKSKAVTINDYLHVHVIPEGNTALTDSHYAFNETTHKKDNSAEKKDLEGTWKAMLNEGYDDKYIITNPENLFDRVKDIIDPKLKSYLEERYWKSWSPEEQQ